MSDVEVYGVGIMCASACAPESMFPDEVEKAVNEAVPHGDDSSLEWKISDDKTFATGQSNPCPCNKEEGRLHWLLNC